MGKFQTTQQRSMVSRWSNIRFSRALSLILLAVSICHNTNGFSVGQNHHHNHRLPGSARQRAAPSVISDRLVWLQAASTSEPSTTVTENGDNNSDTTVTTTGENVAIVSSPVLRLVYPALVQHAEQYGHANIPLGTASGRQCVTLRRLRTQEKLTETDIGLLDALNFTWHSLEDVYVQQKDYNSMLLKTMGTCHPRKSTRPIRNSGHG
jgi:hypothetical protein